MKALKSKIKKLGYDVLELRDLTYVVGGFDPNPQPEESCDGGCTKRCVSCKDGCNSGTY